MVDRVGTGLGLVGSWYGFVESGLPSALRFPTLSTVSLFGSFPGPQVFAMYTFLGPGLSKCSTVCRFGSPGPQTVVVLDSILHLQIPMCCTVYMFCALVPLVHVGIRGGPCGLQTVGREWFISKKGFSVIGSPG